ncbi:hypothetical protein DV735_g3086, partial [Chaetothyriales sp. CBS 134920]
MAPSPSSSLLSCCWRSIISEIGPVAQSQTRRSLVTIQRGPVQKLDLPPVVPQNFWSQLPTRLRPDRRKREIVVHEAPASEREACKEPIKLVDSQQLSRLDPTGARAKLFDPANDHAAKPGDILLTTFTSGEPFAGIVVAVKGSGPHKSVLLRNHLTRVGTEMLIKIHSPLVQSMEIAKRGTKRRKRARLYYLRQPKHDIGSVQATTPVVAALNKPYDINIKQDIAGLSADTQGDQATALTDNEGPHPSPTDIDPSHVRDQVDSKLAADRHGFLTSEPMRVTFTDHPTVFYVQKDIIRRLLGRGVDTDGQLDQAEIRLTAVHPDIVSIIIRAFFSRTLRQADLGLRKLSSSAVLDLYAAATKLGHHQWIRMACLAELERRPTALTDIIAEFKVLYRNGNADQEARETFKRMVGRELDRDWVVDAISQFLADISRKGGDLTANLVEAVVRKRLVEDNSFGLPTAPEAIKILGKDDDGALHPAWRRGAESSSGDGPAAHSAGKASSDNGVWLGPATDWQQSPQRWSQNLPLRSGLVQTHPASVAAWGITADPQEVTHEISQVGEDRVTPQPATPHLAQPRSQAVPQLPVTCTTSLPDLFAPMRSAELRNNRARVILVSNEGVQSGIEPVAAFANEHGGKQTSLPAGIHAALPHSDEAPIGMPHSVPNFGFNRAVSVGNGMMHPTSMGAYGLAGRTMVATRDSGMDCTLFFRAGDVISNIVPLYPNAGQTSAPFPLSYAGAITYLQGICRGRAGQFPGSYVNELKQPVFQGLATAFDSTTTSEALRTRLDAHMGPRAVEEMSMTLAPLGRERAEGEEPRCGNWGCGKEQCPDRRGDEIRIGRRETRKDVEANLDALEADVQDLLASIAAVERDPYSFGIDTAEVARRRQFVSDVRNEVGAMRSELVVDDDGSRQNDEQLDGVYRSVGVLRGQAEEMGRELEEQAFLIDEVDTLADRVGGKLQAGVKRVGEVIRKNEDTMSSCCIAVLILVLIILLVLLIII